METIMFTAILALVMISVMALTALWFVVRECREFSSLLQTALDSKMKEIKKLAELNNAVQASQAAIGERLDALEFRLNTQLPSATKFGR